MVWYLKVMCCSTRALANIMECSTCTLSSAVPWTTSRLGRGSLDSGGFVGLFILIFIII